MHKFHSNALGVLVGMSLISGCASIQGFPDRPDDVGKSLKALKKTYSIDVVLQKFRDEKITPEAQLSYRNEVISGRMLTIDMQYSLYQKGLYSQGVGSQIGLDIVELGLGGAGALVDGGTSQILSAVSGGIAGTQSSIDKTLFYDQTLPAILAVMNSERTTIRTRIEKGEQLSLTDYPITRALSDLENYYFAGTIPGAISQITAQAGEEQAEANSELKKTVDEKFFNSAAIDRVVSLNKLVDQLTSDDVAVKIIKQMESELDANSAARLAIFKTKGGSNFNTGGVEGKNVLKAIIGNMTDRSVENINKWKVAIETELS